VTSPTFLKIRWFGTEWFGLLLAWGSAICKIFDSFDIYPKAMSNGRWIWHTFDVRWAGCKLVGNKFDTILIYAMANGQWIWHTFDTRVELVGKKIWHRFDISKQWQMASRFDILLTQDQSWWVVKQFWYVKTMANGEWILHTFDTRGSRLANNLT